MYRDTEARAEGRLKSVIIQCQGEVNRQATNLSKTDGTRPIRQMRIKADLERAELKLRNAEQDLENYYTELAGREDTRVLSGSKRVEQVVCRDSL